MNLINKCVFCLKEETISNSVFSNVFKSEQAYLVSIKTHRVAAKLCRMFGRKTRLDYLDIKKNKYQNCHLIFDNESATYLTKKQLLSLKEGNNKIVLFLIDELANDYLSINNARALIKEKAFDEVYTYSAYDAAKYGFKHALCYYSKFDTSEDVSVAYDAFFIGNVKKRSAIINDFLTESNKHGLKNLFLLSGNTSAISGGPFKEISFMDYQSSISELRKCNCIIDFVDDKNKGQSLRYFEAIVYNKKLITNNPNIKDLPLYNKKYMRIINEINEIDYEWVKKRELIDYGYDSRFEPINLVKLLNGGQNT